MGLAIGTLSKGTVGSTTAEVIATTATGGTTPYTYAWYKSLVTGFTPGPSNLIDDSDTLDYIDSGLIPGTQYYYKQIVVDSAATPAAATSAELSVLTETGNQIMNQFSQSPYLGMLDLAYNYNTIAVQIDLDETAEIIAGQPVKFTQDAGGVPKVTLCTANTDVPAGAINFNIKNRVFVAGDYAEMSQRGNVMYLYSTAAIARGARVMLDVSTKGGVITATTGKPVFGFALDVASAAGQLIRIELMTPGYELAP